MTKRYRPGETFRPPSAGVWNDALEAARNAGETVGTTGDIGLGPPGTSPEIIRVLNSSGSALDRHSVLGIDSPIFTPADGVDAFLREVTFRGVTPTSAHVGKFVITLEPAEPNQVVRAYVAGTCQVKIDVGDEGHAFAEISEGTTGGLISRAQGTAQILWKAIGSTAVDAIIRFRSTCIACPPIIECPERIKVRVRDQCVAWGSDRYIEGATVTAKDVAAVMADVTVLTDANGWAELELAGPGTFDVHVTVGGCTEIVEDVTLIECEVKELPDVAPCCGELCVEVYDYDSGSPIAGAEVGSGATDTNGEICFTPFAGQEFSFFGVQADGYLDGIRSLMKWCFSCDCAPDAIANHPVSMFSSAVYVLGGVRGHVPDCGPEEDCLLAKTVRPFNVFKRTIFVSFTGPEAIFGSASSGVQIDWDPAEGDIGAWVGWTTGGYGWKVTRVYDAGTNSWTETARERFDFPSARVRIVAVTAVDINSTRLEWTNYIDAGGTTRAFPGYVFETSGTQWTTGYTVVWLERDLYCDNYSYPFEIWNDFTPAGVVTVDDLCERLTTIGLSSTPSSGHYFQGFNSGMCAPVDVSAGFWCAPDPSGLCPYGDRPTATATLYE